MALLDDKSAAELVGSMRAARNKAADAIEEQLAQGGARLRSATKTRKSALTRQRIMTAASDLMYERGSTNFQMSEVSERCHMSKGSLYYYFADRDELIDAVFAECVDDLVEAVETVTAKADSAYDALVALYAEFSRRLKAGSPLALAMTYQLAGSGDLAVPKMATHFARATRLIAAQIERAKQEGIVRADVDSLLAAIFATGGFIATSLVAGDHEVKNLDETAGRFLRVTLHGIGSEEEE